MLGNTLDKFRPLIHLSLSLSLIRVPISVPQFRASFSGNWGREYKICREHPRLPSGSGWAQCLWKYYANVTVFSLGNPFNRSFQHLRSLETKGARNDKHNLFTMGIIGKVWVAVTLGALPCSPCLLCHRLWPSLVMPISPLGKGFLRVVLPRAFYLSLLRFCILYSGIQLPQWRSFNFSKQSSKGPNIGRPGYKNHHRVQTWKNLSGITTPPKES